MNEDTRTDSLKGLQELIKFFEAHPEIELPDFDFPIYFFREEAKKRVKEIAYSLGTFEKSESESYLTLKKRFGGEVTLRAVFTRSAVCTKRVVGTRKVMKDVYPASVEPARIEVEEDVVEWDCPSLLKDDETTSTAAEPLQQDSSIPDEEPELVQR